MSASPAVATKVRACLDITNSCAKSNDAPETNIRAPPRFPSSLPTNHTQEMCFTCFDVLLAHLTGAAAPMPTYEDHLW